MSSIAVRAASRAEASSVEAALEPSVEPPAASLMTWLLFMLMVAVTIWFAKPEVLAVCAACMMARLTTTAAVMMVNTMTSRMEYPLRRHVDLHAFSNIMTCPLLGAETRP